MPYQMNSLQCAIAIVTMAFVFGFITFVICTLRMNAEADDWMEGKKG